MPFGTNSSLAKMIEASRQIRELFDRIEIATESVDSVLLLGASHAEREQVAAALHALSGRRGELVFAHQAESTEVNWFQQGREGTLYIEDVERLSQSSQVALTRALVEGAHTRENCRVIAGTGGQIEREIEAGSFREDLFRLLSHIRIDVSALQHPLADFPLPPAQEVAELVDRAGEQNFSLRDVEREYILEIMRKTGGNKSRAAEWLGLDRKTLYRKLDEYRGLKDAVREPAH